MMKDADEAAMRDAAVRGSDANLNVLRGSKPTGI